MKQRFIFWFFTRRVQSAVSGGSKEEPIFFFFKELPHPQDVFDINVQILVHQIMWLAVDTYSTWMHGPTPGWHLICDVFTGWIVEWTGDGMEQPSEWIPELTERTLMQIPFNVFLFSEVHSRLNCVVFLWFINAPILKTVRGQTVHHKLQGNITYLGQWCLPCRCTAQLLLYIWFSWWIFINTFIISPSSPVVPGCFLTITALKSPVPCLSDDCPGDNQSKVLQEACQGAYKDPAAPITGLCAVCMLS